MANFDALNPNLKSVFENSKIIFWGFPFFGKF